MCRCKIPYSSWQHGLHTETAVVHRTHGLSGGGRGLRTQRVRASYSWSAPIYESHMKYSIRRAGPGAAGATKDSVALEARPSFTRLMASSVLAFVSPSTSHHCSSLRPGYLRKKRRLASAMKRACKRFRCRPCSVAYVQADVAFAIANPAQAAISATNAASAHIHRTASASASSMLGSMSRSAPWSVDRWQDGALHLSLQLHRQLHLCTQTRMFDISAPPHRSPVALARFPRDRNIAAAMKPILRGRDGRRRPGRRGVSNGAHRQEDSMVSTASLRHAQNTVQGKEHSVAIKTPAEESMLVTEAQGEGVPEEGARHAPARRRGRCRRPELGAPSGCPGTGCRSGPHRSAAPRSAAAVLAYRPPEWAARSRISPGSPTDFRLNSKV